MFTLKNRRRHLLIVVGACLLTVAGTLMLANASTIHWQSNYMDVYFDWNGTWDKTAYWAYGMWVFNVYDWSYLFGWYGLGWDKLSPLNTAPSSRLQFYFYNDSNDNASGWSSGLTIKFNLAHMDTLDIATTKWAGQVLHFGNTVSHEASHSIFGAYVGTTSPDGYGSNWLTESLAYYTGGGLWAWGKGEWATGGWAPLYSTADIKTMYRNGVNASGSGGLLTFLDCGKTYYSDFANPGPKFWNSWDTFHAVGGYLSNMTDTSGKRQGVYNTAYFLQGLRAGKSISNAFYGVWGVTLNQNANSKTNTGDFYYYFYTYWWS